MIEFGQAPPPILPVPYRNSSGAPLGVEIVPLSRLRRVAGGTHLLRPQRMEFMLLLLFEAGIGRHTIDFVGHPACPGVVLAVQPGQVQQFHLDPAMDGRIVAIDPAFLAAGPIAGDLAVATAVPPPVWEECRTIAAHIADDSAAYAEQPLASGLLRHRVETLLHLLALHAPAPPPAAGSHPALLAEFRRLIDRHHAQRRTVAWYAGRLGYAERTLARACLAGAGQSPKQMIDARLMLEAKRLLAHTADSVADIADALGFSEPTNFVRHFRAAVRRTPAAFRRDVQAAHAGADRTAAT